MSSMNTTSIARRCYRCDYEWKQRGTSTPRQCPYCKSPKWAIKRDGNVQANKPSPGVHYELEPSASRLFKIGLSANPKARLQQLQSESAYPLQMVACRIVYAPFVQATEQLLHKLFSHCRTHGEWFKLTEDEVSWFMRDHWLSFHLDRTGSMVTFDGD
jgi:hypothetical protein